MNCTDNTAEEDPLLSIDSSSGTSIPSSASTSSMTNDADSDDPERRFRSDDDTSPRKHLNRTKIGFFGSKRGVWVSHSRLLCLVMVLDLMTLSVQVSSATKIYVDALLLADTFCVSSRRSVLPVQPVQNPAL